MPTWRVPGGTGQTFDWGWLPANERTESYLPGADCPKCSKRSTLLPTRLTSVGVELSKGIKDKIALQAFVKEVRNCKKDH